MVEQHKKNRVLMIEGMAAAVVVIFVAAFLIDKYLPTPMVGEGTGAPGIVGFVPVEIKSQPIDLAAAQSAKFIVFSEKEQEFQLTSLRISGEVTGEGRAEVWLDNGLGQQLLVYSNIRMKQGNMITGMSVSEESTPIPEGAKIEDAPAEQAWFKITPAEGVFEERPTMELGDDKRVVQGVFQYECSETCYMSMKMKKGLFYTLKLLVDDGTQIKINELKYMLEV